MRYTLLDQVDGDMSVYIIENQQGRRQTLHRNRLFLVERVNPEQDHEIAARLFEVASTLIGCGVPHREMNAESTPPNEVQARAASLMSIDAQDAQVSKLMMSASRALGTIFAEYWSPKE